MFSKFLGYLLKGFLCFVVWFAGANIIYGLAIPFLIVLYLGGTLWLIYIFFLELPDIVKDIFTPPRPKSEIQHKGASQYSLDEALRNGAITEWMYGEEHKKGSGFTNESEINHIAVEEPAMEEFPTAAEDSHENEFLEAIEDDENITLRCPNCGTKHEFPHEKMSQFFKPICLTCMRHFS